MTTEGADGRSRWFAWHLNWFERDGITDIGAKFGPNAWAVLLWLHKLAAMTPRNPAGWVKAGYVAGAVHALVGDPLKVREIVLYAAKIGVLDELEEEPGGRKFTARISGFENDQRLAEQAVRKRTSRAGMSQDVTHTTPHHKGSSEEEPAGSGVERELFDFWREECGHPRARLTTDRRTKLRARLRDGYSPEQIRTAIRGAAVSPTVVDGRKYDDLELICRNGSKLEDYIARGEAGEEKKRGDDDWRRKMGME